VCACASFSSSKTGNAAIQSKPDSKNTYGWCVQAFLCVFSAAAVLLCVRPLFLCTPLSPSVELCVLCARVVGVSRDLSRAQE
jgi:hypothetical protein